MADVIYKAATEFISSDPTGNRYDVLIAMESPDRKGDVILNSAWRLDNFLKNPVLLWAHDRTIPPIGRINGLELTSDGLVGEMEFAATPFAQEIKGLYDDQFIRGVSVGFLPLKSELGRPIPGRGGQRGYRYLEAELLEVSCVPIPMHADTLIRRALEDTSYSPAVSQLMTDLIYIGENIGKVL